MPSSLPETATIGAGSSGMAASREPHLDKERRAGAQRARDAGFRLPVRLDQKASEAVPAT
ncbi:MAG: hypothetical protein JWO02_3578 [Solirubrobacterales bacterium]|nr:hypothetical protein [Solirubrobacterales bacterium]